MDAEAVERALAALKAGAELPEEPGAWDLIPLDDRARRRYWQVERIRARTNREMRERIPVECARCERSFHRRTMNQKFCDDCIAMRKRLK